MQKDIAKTVYFLCSLFMIVLIYSFSAQNYKQTNETSDVIVKPVQEAAKENIKKEFKDEKEKEKYIKKMNN
ncbi:MAG: hypothetical protein IJR45_07965, partial [Firmicutes bacterium]|nr:hypothetical protein [Bacillota bacterium]